VEKVEGSEGGRGRERHGGVRWEDRGEDVSLLCFFVQTGKPAEE